MNIKIYAMTHKAFDVPTDPMYQPLHVGWEGKKDLGYPGDNTGENISHLNCYYSELTGFYWLWKNCKNLDYIGTCHYRRFLINRQGLAFTKAELEVLLREYDLVTTKRVVLNNSYHYGFSANHNIHALDTTGEVIRDLYPEYYDTYLTLVHQNETYFGNMIITGKELFDEYCEWLFTIFAEVENRINLDTDEDAYHKRVLGFISEFLLLVWVRVKGLKVYECKVGMTGEKAETKELKETLAEYFRKKDIEGAKEYFLKRKAERPDVMMEASDVSGELRICMQIIATAGMEMEVYGTSILDRISEYQELIELFARLNQIITRSMKAQDSFGEISGEHRAFLQEKGISDVAISVAKTVYQATVNS
ncbi:MAG: DUF4422 domain-containing protein [Agathobacter sp.]